MLSTLNKTSKDSYSYFVSIRRLERVNFNVFEKSQFIVVYRSGDKRKSIRRSVSLWSDVRTRQGRIAEDRTRIRQPEQHINRILSEDAVKAVQQRPRLERCRKRSGKETNRQRYRRSCKKTSRLVTPDEIDNLSQNPRKHWATVKNGCTPLIKIKLVPKKRIVQRAQLLLLFLLTLFENTDYWSRLTTLPPVGRWCHCILCSSHI